MAAPAAAAASSSSAATGASTAATVASAAAPAVGGILGLIGAKKRMKLQNKLNMQLAQYQNSLAVEQWNRENEYNLPKNQIARLREAGLNPRLAYGDSATTLSAKSPQMVAPEQSAAPNYLERIGQTFTDQVSALNQINEIRMQEERIKAAQKQNQLLDLDLRFKPLQATAGLQHLGLGNVSKLAKYMLEYGSNPYWAADNDGGTAYYYPSLNNVVIGNGNALLRRNLMEKTLTNVGYRNTMLSKQIENYLPYVGDLPSMLRIGASVLTNNLFGGLKNIIQMSYKFRKIYGK